MNGINAININATFASHIFNLSWMYKNTKNNIGISLQSNMSSKKNFEIPPIIISAFDDASTNNVGNMLKIVFAM